MGLPVLEIHLILNARAVSTVLFAFAIGPVFGCDHDEDTHKTPEPPLSVEVALDSLPATDPPRPAGDLRADLDAFQSVDDCMKKRTVSMDPLVADGLGAIGYDTFLRDACRMLEAEKIGDGAKCEGIDASSLRMRCKSMVAMIAGRADDCPLRSDADVRFGRDPTCVAAALRSPALCAGETHLKKNMCEALVAHDAKKCEAVVGADHDACVRDADREKAVISGDPKVGAIAKAAGDLEIHGAGRDDPAETKVDLLPDVETGAVVVLGSKESRYDVGPLGIASAASKSVAPQTRTRLAFTIHNGEKKSTLDRLELAVPGSVTIACDSKCDLAVKQNALDKTRGGAIDLTIEGTVGAPPQAFKIKAHIATFVRDVVQR